MVPSLPAGPSIEIDLTVAKYVKFRSGPDSNDKVRGAMGAQLFILVTNISRSRMFDVFPERRRRLRG